MTNNNICVLVKIFGLIAKRGAELSLDPLCRKLDRGQRVLDLMRDPPGHIAPSGHALRRHQIGNIVKGHNIAFQPPRISITTAHPDEQAFHLPFTGEADFLLN